jgi:glycosyltransferase involved in cell wall biosynthesis
MDSNPLVSVIMIFLNAQSYIQEAIESIFSQRYVNWELLLIDDGSTDESTQIAKSYSAKHPDKIRYFEHLGHQNRGMSTSRNVGISHSRGTYVAFLDADDIWLPEKLERQIAIMQKHPEIEFIINPALYWNLNGTKEPQRMTLVEGQLPPGAWIPKILQDGDNAACPSSIMAQRAALVQVGGFENWAPNLVEDQVMWLKVSLEDLSLYFDPTCLNVYRIHASSCCMAASSGRKLESHIKLYSWLIGCLKKNTKFRNRFGQYLSIAELKLWEILIERASQLARGNGSYTPLNRLARFRANWNLIQLCKSYPGSKISGLLLLQAFSGSIAERLKNWIIPVPPEWT